LAALLLGAMLYVFAATALGLLASTLVRTRIAGIIACAIITTVPAINFSGYLYPVASLEGAGRVIGMMFPALWFQEISLGTLAKARPFADLQPGLLVLFGFGVLYLMLAAALLRKQER
jgi:ribosome-dependent ATPase